MPVWVISLIGKILEPIIRPIVEAAIAEIKNAWIQSRIDHVNQNQDAVNAAFNSLAAAQTTEEKANAAKALAAAFNNRGTN